eukprot:9609810-Alexandrium_andersonii.AAC.1
MRKAVKDRWAAVRPPGDESGGRPLNCKKHRPGNKLRNSYVSSTGTLTTLTLATIGVYDKS